MKNIPKCTLLFFLLSWLVSSCDKDDNTSGVTELALTASTTEVLIKPDLSKEEVLNFTWNPIFLYTGQTDVEYTWTMDVKGNGFQNPITIYIGRSEKHMLTFTHKDLEKRLRTHGSILTGNTVDYESKLTGDLHSETIAPVVSNIIELRITLSESNTEGGNLDDYDNDDY